jgi:hypothetical protein
MPDTLISGQMLDMLPHESATDTILIFSEKATACDWGLKSFDPAIWLRQAELIGYRIYLWDAYCDGSLGTMTWNPTHGGQCADTINLWWALRPNENQSELNEEALSCYLWDTGKVGPEEMRPAYAARYTRDDLFRPRHSSAPAKWLQHELEKNRRFILWDMNDKGDKVHYCAPSRTLSDLERWKKFRDNQADVLAILIGAARGIDARLGQPDYPVLFDRNGVWLVSGDGTRTKVGPRIKCDLSIGTAGAA